MSRTRIFLIYFVLASLQTLYMSSEACFARKRPDSFEEHKVSELVGVETGTGFGQLAPDFTLSDIEGRLVKLSELRGQEVLLVFLNIHCPYCTAKIPILNEVQESGLKVVSVALGSPARQVRKYIKDKNIRFDVLPDTNRTVGKSYGIESVPQLFWIDTDGTIAWSGPEDGQEIWSYLGDQEIQTNSSLDLEVYFVPYVGDIDGSIDTEWFSFYDQLRQWHDSNSIPASFSFYPGTMNSEQFNLIIADMYDSNNVELILKGEEEFEGTRLDYMTYSEVKEALEAWQTKFIYELEQLGYSDVQSPVTYNQLQQRFNETIRNAAHDVGFQMYFEHGVSDEYGYIDMLPDFDITQYSVPLTTTGAPGPNEVFKQPEEVIQEVLDFSDDEMIYINGIKVVPLLCHQQDFRITEESSDVNEAKWDIYTSLLTMAEADERIQLIKPEEVYELRHKYLRNYIFTDFGTSDHGWIAAGLGQSKFEIGEPVPFDPCEGACLTECFGTGPSEDHSPDDVNAACTNLDGHMAPNAYILTNSLTSPVYDLSGYTDVTLELWRYMEIEGENYDYCYYQYKDDPEGEWTSFDIYGASEVNDVNWVHYAKNLSSIADGKSYFQLRFYCTTDDWYEGSGLCLDDIKLSWIVTSDFNIDKVVDFIDYSELASLWMIYANDSNFIDIYDLSDNNVIDTADLDIFVDDWLLGVEP